MGKPLPYTPRNSQLRSECVECALPYKYQWVCFVDVVVSTIQHIVMRRSRSLWVEYGEPRVSTTLIPMGMLYSLRLTHLMTLCSLFNNNVCDLKCNWTYGGTYIQVCCLLVEFMSLFERLCWRFPGVLVINRRR